MAATYLLGRTQNAMSPPLYLMGAAVISALFILSLEETAKLPLAERLSGVNYPKAATNYVSVQNSRLLKPQLLRRETSISGPEE